MGRFFRGFSPLVLLPVIFGCVLCIKVPPSPCKTIFNYFESKSNEVFGGVSFENDLSEHYEVEVFMHVNVKTNKNIIIKRKTPNFQIQNGQRIEYRILFPFVNHTFPILSNVSFNNKLYCVGPPPTGGDVTHLSARDSVDLEIVDWLRPKTPATLVPTKIDKSVRNDDSCGINSEYVPLSFNAQKTKIGEFPWLVGIFDQLSKDKVYRFRCGATLVSKHHVITAAHCVATGEGSPLRDDAFTLVLGTHDILSWVTDATTRKVRSIFVHPAYEGENDNDIAMMVMDRPVDYTKTITPACLWKEQPDIEIVIGQKGLVAGWGRDETGREYVEIARKVTLPIVSNHDCSKSNNQFSPLLSARAFCAGYRNGSAPCSGDSGGGLVLQREDRKYYLRGVVSIALPIIDSETKEKRCNEKEYVIFIDVAQYSYWVKSVMDQRL